MLRLFYDRNGKDPIEVKETGTRAYVGTTTYEIFAHFDGIDYDIFSSALLYLKRPGINGEYIFSGEGLAVTSSRVSKKLVFNPEDGELLYFENNHYYDGFNFVLKGEDDVDTNFWLDTPGEWEGTIVLTSSNREVVTGTFSFNVAPSGIDGEDNEIILEPYNELLRLINSKLNLDSAFYIRVVSELPTEFESSKYHVGDIVLVKNEANNIKLYKVLAVDTEASEEEEIAEEFAFDKLIVDDEFVFGDANAVLTSRIVNGEKQVELITESGNKYIFKNGSFYCTEQNANLGSSNAKWNNLYISGKITDGANEITAAQMKEAYEVSKHIPTEINFYPITVDEIDELFN